MHEAPDTSNVKPPQMDQRLQIPMTSYGLMRAFRFAAKEAAEPVQFFLGPFATLEMGDVIHDVRPEDRDGIGGYEYMDKFVVATVQQSGDEYAEVLTQEEVILKAHDCIRELSLLMWRKLVIVQDIDVISAADHEPTPEVPKQLRKGIVVAATNRKNLPFSCFIV